jgi:hypothetical protein
VLNKTVITTLHKYTPSNITIRHDLNSIGSGELPIVDLCDDGDEYRNSITRNFSNNLNHY